MDFQTGDRVHVLSHAHYARGCNGVASGACETDGSQWVEVQFKEEQHWFLPSELLMVVRPAQPLPYHRHELATQLEAAEAEVQARGAEIDRLSKQLSVKTRFEARVPELEWQLSVERANAEARLELNRQQGVKITYLQNYRDAVERQIGVLEAENKRLRERDDQRLSQSATEAARVAIAEYLDLWRVNTDGDATFRITHNEYVPGALADRVVAAIRRAL